MSARKYDVPTGVAWVSVDDLELSVRLVKQLKERGWDTVGEVVDNLDKIAEIGGIGRRSMDELHGVLAHLCGQPTPKQEAEELKRALSLAVEALTWIRNEARPGGNSGVTAGGWGIRLSRCGEVAGEALAELAPFSG